MTVKCGSGDNLMIYAAVEFCKEGDIMVVTTKIKPRTVNGSVVCAGIQINAGDLILADDDGVVTVKQEEVEKALESAKKREYKEIETLKKIKNGELGIDFYGFRERISGLNIEYID